ncbi:hypothetical protein GCM10023153_09990 [Ornithinibacter aureus]|uniref:Uncharacterized protein n=1 Tax=Ornithinibacter aureus TaxID=622664 RepID=A0ABP8JJ44_9MICO|nr:hypothetical protein [Ornithinibacter aureus]KAF0833801.1 hypothetical protein C8E84_1598 [Ornithinibacter aureus]
MNIIFTLASSFALGYFIKQRGLAILTYLALDATVFAYQTLAVLLEWLGPQQGFEGEAFGPKPHGFPVQFSPHELAGYGVVNLLVITAGVGLVVLGSHLARRRVRTRPAPQRLEPAA